MKCFGNGMVHDVIGRRGEVTWCEEALESDEDTWPAVDENEAVTCLECIAERANAEARSHAFHQRRKSGSAPTKQRSL